MSTTKTEIANTHIMNDQRFQLYFRLGATVLALSAVVNILLVVEHNRLSASSDDLQNEINMVRDQLPKIDQIVRELAVAGSPNPVIQNILAQSQLVVDLPPPPATTNSATPTTTPTPDEPEASR